MKKLDKYIMGKFLGTFAYGMILFVTIAVVINLSERIDDFMDNNAPLDLIIKQYYFNFIPYIVFLLTPIFTFISVIFFTSQLAYRSEIVAILASGVSFYRILCVPYFFSALLLVGIQLYANHYLVPETSKERIAFERKYFRKQVIKKGEDIHLKISKDTYLYIQNYNKRDTSGTNFTIEKIVDRELKEKMTGRSIRWNRKSGKWQIKNYHIRTIDNLHEKVVLGENKDTLLQLHPDDLTQKIRFKEAMPTPELNVFIDKLKMQGAAYIEFYEVEKHRRTAIPFSTFVLTIIGMAVSSRKSRGGMGFHIFIGLAVSGLYEIVKQFSITFATNGNLSPLLSVWIPNFIFIAMAIYLLYKAPK